MFKLGTKRCVDPLELYDAFAEEELPTDLFAGKANRFVVRPGGTPSSGFVLLRREDLYALDFAAYHTLTVVDHLDHTIQFKSIFIVGAVRVAGGSPADPDGVFLVEVADARQRLSMVPIDKAYNLRKPSGIGFLTGTTNGGTAWTWSDMVSDLWTVVGAVNALGPFPGLPFTPDGTPEGFDFYGGYALASLVTVLHRIGCDLRPDHTTNTYAVVRQGGGSDSTYFAAWTADEKFNGQALATAAGNRPEKVRVRFRVLPVPTDASPYYMVDVALATTAGVHAGSVVIVDDDMAALGTTPTNSAALTSRANERAADWLRKFDKLELPKVVQYREYLKAAAAAVGERRAVAVFEDVGDGYTTEAHTTPKPFPGFGRFNPAEANPKHKTPIGTPCVEYGLYGAIVSIRQAQQNDDGSADCVSWAECVCDSTGQISGYVYDAGGGPVSGRVMKIGGVSKATTNAAGWYLIDSLAAGSYAVEVSAPFTSASYRVNGGAWSAGSTSSSQAVAGGAAVLIDFKLT